MPFFEIDLDFTLYSTILYVNKRDEGHPARQLGDIDMSCYVVSDLTISAIVAAMADTDFEPASLKDEKSGVKYNPATCGQIVGQMLLNANYASVNEYYGKHTRAHEFKLTQKQDGKPFDPWREVRLHRVLRVSGLPAAGYDNSEIHGALDYAKDDLARKMLKNSVRSLSGVLSNLASNKGRPQGRPFPCHFSYDSGS